MSTKPDDDILASASALRNPGDATSFRENGHEILITATALEGLHSGRRRYKVECISCQEVLHHATTGPHAWHREHVKLRPKMWPDGLDWNGSGAWAVVSIVPGTTATGFVIHPSVGVSRWESREHAVSYAQRWRQKGDGFLSVILGWEDDFRSGAVLDNPRVRAALQALEKP